MAILSNHSTEERELEKAAAKLALLEGGEAALIELLTFGGAAVVPLRKLLFQREPSGIYQPRCRAAKALGLLGAYNPLREYLALRREISDPVERTGEDAVINAAARALAGPREALDFQLFLDVLKWRILPGVIESAGAFKRPEAISLFIDALAEDDCRMAAAEALRKLGKIAEPALVQCAGEASPPDAESETKHRQRRSALRLLVEMGISPGSWAGVRHSMQDPDAKIAALACKLALSTPFVPAADREAAFSRLLQILEHAGWILAQEIESFLAEIAPGRRPHLPPAVHGKGRAEL